jgi:hypothetical protein
LLSLVSEAHWGLDQHRLAALLLAALAASFASRSRFPFASIAVAVDA